MNGFINTLTLGLVGNSIHNKKSNTNNINKNNRSNIEKSNTNDIYSTNNERNVRNIYENKAKYNYRKSMDFKNTKIVPNNYKKQEIFNNNDKNKIARIENFANESDSEFTDEETNDDNVSKKSTGSDDGYHGIKQNNNMSVIDRMTSLTNNRKFETCVAKDSTSKRNKYEEKNSWLNQHNLMSFDNTEDPVSINSSNTNTHTTSRIELERQMEIDGGYSSYERNEDGTYGVIHPESTEFVHENMVPFVNKGSNSINETKRNMVNKQKLELFTGSSNNPNWRPKVERAPLFSPLIGASNLYGDPVRTDEYKARYFPGNEKRNELPFQQVKITPGLDIPYNAVGKQGYHDMYRVVPKTTDELRTVNNPKISYKSYV